MKTRSLGSLNVSALGLGCMGMAYAYGPADEAEESLIRRRRKLYVRDSDKAPPEMTFA